MPSGVYIRTEEAKKNMSIAHKGKHSSPETEFKKGSKVNFGKKHTQETKNLLSKISKTHIGDNASNWRGGGIDVFCHYCGKLFKVKRSVFNNVGGKYCSRKCYGAYNSLTVRGENHPNWKGGEKELRKKRWNNLQYRLNERISNSIRNNLKRGVKGKRTWEKLVGYNCEQLKKRLNSTMPTGYTWDDFINGELHIDHIIPVNVHNFSKPEHIDFKRCWSLDNLQLLTASENIKKQDKLIKPFQTSLEI